MDLGNFLDPAVAAELGGVQTQSPRMHEVFRQVVQAARGDSTVLVVGESGSGKELVARAIHRNSSRRRKTLITMNMAAVPNSLMESEMFGSAKGAFTGATTDRVGRFEAAHGGTLFIDEIGDLDIHSQAKLLRTLENGRVTPVGSNTERLIDVRVVTATHRNLEKMCREGTFRSDFYFRLNVVRIVIPPLRERPEDIELLVEYFLEEFSLAYGMPRPQLDDELRRFLMRHRWPGNVRQLRNCVESMVVLSDTDRLTKDDLPQTLVDNVTCRRCEAPRGATLAEVKRTAIVEALDRHGGSVSRAAEQLGISIRTVQRRIKDYSGQSPLHAFAGSEFTANGQPVQLTPRTKSASLGRRRAS
ncbi:MAG: sigma-54 dependent transcriptional regulator [Pirellulaceae bacterium]